MILESIVTTVDAHGNVNIAPMGPVVDGPDLNACLLRPFDSSTTFANLIKTRRAVIHVTDDASLFAKAAVGKVESDDLVCAVEETDDHVRLIDCHRYFAVEITNISDDRPRCEMQCRVVASQVVRPFFGFNRAKHAIIEAAILATRVHLIAADEIRQQLAALRLPVDKTASREDAACFDELVSAIETKIHAAAGCQAGAAK